MDQGIEAGEALYGKIREINRIYGRLLDRGEEEKADELAAGCRPFNRELLRIFKKEQDYFVRLSWHDDVLFPQQAVQENVRAMDRACLLYTSKPAIKAHKGITKEAEDIKDGYYVHIRPGMV